MLTVDVFSFSQAAVQASKVHAKEVDLEHFEWAKVKLPVMNQLVAITMHLLG
jgi:hypothetical protein